MPKSLLKALCKKVDSKCHLANSTSESSELKQSLELPARFKANGDSRLTKLRVIYSNELFLGAEAPMYS